MNIFYENKNRDYYCRDTRFSNAALQCVPHLHYHLELFVLRRGHSRVTVDSKEYDVFPGDLMMVFPNQVHSFECVDPEDYILIIANPDQLSDFEREFNDYLPVSNLVRASEMGLDAAGLLDIFQSFSDAYHGEGAYKNTVMKGHMLTLFAKVFENVGFSDARGGDYRVFGMILNYCISNSDKPLSLDLLEEELHISKYYISHIMSGKLNMGFNDYVNSLRVSNACKHLLNSGRSITEISDIVGFNTLRTFNRAFKKQIGCTPSEYRTQKNKPEFTKKSKDK